LKGPFGYSRRRCKWKVYRGNSNTGDFTRNRVSGRNGKGLRPAEGGVNPGAGHFKWVYGFRHRRIGMSKKLYVGNLSYEVTEEDLKRNFGEVGECIAANIVRDRYSGNSRGFGFVEMATEEEAQEAMRKLNGGELSGRKIIVQEARPRKERPRNSFGRSGFGRREGF
jgi:cold-inducible RNA-binding protein